MFIGKKFPTVASFLAILALEEIGKGINLIENSENNNDLTKKNGKN